MKKYISWHLFGDNWDEWYQTRKEAEEAYKSCNDFNLRLYKTVSYDNNTSDTEEFYIRGRGNFPW